MNCVICKSNLSNCVIYMAYDKSHCSEKCRDDTIRMYESKNKNNCLYYYLNNDIDNEYDYLTDFNFKKNNIDNTNNEKNNCTTDYLFIYIKKLFFQ